MMMSVLRMGAERMLGPVKWPSDAFQDALHSNGQTLCTVACALVFNDLEHMHGDFIGDALHTLRKGTVGRLRHYNFLFRKKKK